MPRVFLEQPLSLGANVTIAGEDGHHFSRVLRAKPGEAVAMASNGTSFLGTIQSVDSAEGTLTVMVERRLPSHEPSVRVILIQGLAKGDKIEEILQKCTETGATGFIVVATNRSVVQLDAKKASSKLTRWQRQTREAARQSQRDMIPAVDYAHSWPEAGDILRRAEPDLVLMLDENQSALGIRRAMAAWTEAGASIPRAPVIAMLVGPEGGWADEERAWLTEHLAARSVTLGPRILRTETAGVAALSAVLYEYGDMGGR